VVSEETAKGWKELTQKMACASAQWAWNEKVTRNKARVGPIQAPLGNVQNERVAPDHILAGTRKNC